MRKYVYTALMMACMGLIAGCSSLGPNDAQTAAMGQAYAKYIDQQRSCQIIHIKGSDTQPATISGTEITMSAPLPPLTAMGNDETRARIMEQVASVMRMGIGAAAAYGIVKAATGDATGINDCSPVTNGATP